MGSLDVPARLHRLAPVCVAVCGLVFVCALRLWPEAGGQLTAVYPPWWDGRAAFVAASDSGAVVSVGRLPFVVGVRGEGDLGRRLRDHGALFVLSGSLAELCGVDTGASRVR